MTSLHFSEIGSIPVTTLDQVRFFIGGLVAIIKENIDQSRTFQIVKKQEDELSTQSYSLTIHRHEGLDDCYSIQHCSATTPCGITFDELIYWVHREL